ncbi:MAG: hydroxyacid dehydrogenase [Candidatus Vogelbacteria bacterium CG10_big_fil_rev_8_21_14_0_10_45_14]|uniref:Hydroxyacid dehydrogenase n=1 Tax=Candidatus Vogelbacteria bacterium CG10_big_fil_rev_8_21_14_0_10_45_14 TaxID=1975042 RepID=A0A2H0RKN3_9BACT|nr:MAG: hydroxyacid dehydrogenase [Candidatus Vogelbacteria bacterium CG10_big_fil_rev_8_21_14_0_10_45_14]
MNIVIYGGYKEWEVDEFKQRLEGHSLVFVSETVQNAGAELSKDADVVSVFVDSKLTKEDLELMPKLKMISTRSTGYDHIDLASAKKRGIVVSNVPTYGENTVAEYAFALLLALARRTYESTERVRETGSFSQDGLEGFDILGKTIGVVGTGHIGLHSIKIAKGFGMDVVAFDVNHNVEEAANMGFIYVGMDELLRDSDVITLHAPYNDHTHHMIGKTEFAKMRKGTYLINTARGGLVDTEAMVCALRDGILAGAGLDVLEGEADLKNELDLLEGGDDKQERMKTLLENHFLVDHPRVIIAPHNAYNTREAIMRILTTTISNIEAFSAGTPINTVG